LRSKALEFLLNKAEAEESKPPGWHPAQYFADAAIRESKEASPAALKYLFRSLPSASSPGVRYTLDQLDHIDPVAVPLLIEYLGATDRLQRCYACILLGKVGASAKAAVPGLIATVENVNCGVRPWAIDALGLIGIAAQTAEPLLKALLDDKQLGSHARDALLRITRQRYSSDGSSRVNSSILR
jgi:HEAT repeat protein